MNQEVKPAYTGSEVDLPVVSGMICHSCLTNLKTFAAQKPKYTKDLVQEILDRSKTASLIPNLEQRQSQSALFGKAISNAANICASNFPSLVNYMENAFDESSLLGLKKMAGGTYYITARKNWSDATLMNSMMLTFIDIYDTDLTKAGMPDSFPTKCIENSNTFSDALNTYEEYKGTAEQQRQSKVEANNGVYKSLISIMKDGKFIYRADDALKKQFTFSAVFAKVTTNKRSGFTIKVNAPVTGKIVNTAEFRLNGYTSSFKASRSDIITAKVSEGTYTGIITAPGYLPLSVKFIFNKGVTHREEVTLSLGVAVAG